MCLSARGKVGGRRRVEGKMRDRVKVCMEEGEREDRERKCVKGVYGGRMGAGMD